MLCIFVRKRNYFYGIILLLAAALLGGMAGSVFFGDGRFFVSQVGAIIKLQPIYRVQTAQKQIAISFDATWGGEYTAEIVNKLADYRITATFFLPNGWIEEYPELTKQIAQAGHEIGLHSATHPHFTYLSAAGMEKEIQQNYQMIQNTTGQSARLFRPPFGAYNNTLIKVCDRLSIVPVIWSIDSLDWQNKSAKEITATVLHQAKPGEIMLFDANGCHTAAALDMIFAKLLLEQYQIVPVSRLLLQEDAYVDYSGCQRSLP